METNSGTNIIKIEPEFTYLEGLCPSKSRPEYWNRLGSSKSWSVAQPNETEPVRLKRPVTNRGPILLGELVAILMALEFAQIDYRKRQVHGITIFSDSQSAVGILSLGWSNSSHKKTAEDIRRLISDLEKSGLEVSIKLKDEEFKEHRIGLLMIVIASRALRGSSESK